MSKDDITNKLQESIRLKLFKYKKLTPLFKAKVFQHVAEKMHHLQMLKMVTSQLETYNLDAIINFGK